MTDLEQRPSLKPGCRLGPGGDVLLIPEGALRLQGPARHIVTACDGIRSVRQIVGHLLTLFPDADAAKVSEETVSFLAKLAEKGVVEFAPAMK